VPNQPAASTAHHHTVSPACGITAVSDLLLLPVLSRDEIAKQPEHLLLDSSATWHRSGQQQTGHPLQDAPLPSIHAVTELLPSFPGIAMGPVAGGRIDETGVTDTATDTLAPEISGTVLLENIAPPASGGPVLMATRNAAPQRLGRALVLHGLIITGLVRGGVGHRIHGMGTAVTSCATEAAVSGGVTEEGTAGIHAGHPGVAVDALGFIDPGDL
jgi:hypothetical protein